MENNKATEIAKINDRLRKTMPMGQLNIELSEKVSGSPDRSAITMAVRKYKDFDSEIDLAGDHSIGLVVVSGDAYVFRFTYGDERYDYSREVGQRTLGIMHASEFKSLKLGRKVESSVRKILEEGLG